MRTRSPRHDVSRRAAGGFAEPGHIPSAGRLFAPGGAAGPSRAPGPGLTGDRGGPGDADAALRVGAVALLLPLEVEGADAATGAHGLVVQKVGGHDPGHLELQPVRVPAVEARGR